MLKLKSQLTCSYCSKIAKDPIELPCEDLICRKHLSERDVAKKNKIKCKKCNESFQVKDNQFKSIKALTQLIETQSYLNEEEIRLKEEYEASIRKFFEFHEKFMENKTQLQSNVFEHFQEMRFQIDEHREKFKKKIDDIALKMIDQTKKNEAMYLQDLKKNFSSLDETQSLEGNLNEIEELFRDPNLLIESIGEMQRKQEESLSDIQLKLNQMSQVKVDLMATNYFKPNLSMFDQEEETSVFASIRLYGYSFSNMNSLKSEILTDDQSIELIKLCEFSPNDKWSLLYRGTRDGFGSDVFHSKCDNHSNTLTIIKAKQSSYIFGGYTTVGWESSAYAKYKSDQNAFIFSLTNKDNKPLKMEIDPGYHHRAICCHSSFGPSFGDDICIKNNANTTMDNFSRLGDTYSHPQYRYGTNEAKTFMAGSYNFLLDEIEVYQKRIKRHFSF
jgi:hypothetical protein